MKNEFWENFIDGFILCGLSFSAVFTFVLIYLAYLK